MFLFAMILIYKSSPIALLQAEQHMAQGSVDFFRFILELTRSGLLDHKKKVLKEGLTS